MGDTSQQHGTCAKYLYADIHQYSEKAVHVVQKQFSLAMKKDGFNTEHVQVLYQRKIHAFCLTCPSDLGYALSNLMELVLEEFDAKRHVFEDDTQCLSEVALDTGELGVSAHSEIEPVSQSPTAKDPWQVKVLRNINSSRARAKLLFYADLDKDVQIHYKNCLKRSEAGAQVQNLRLLKAVRYDEDEQEWRYLKPTSGSGMQLHDPDILAAFVVPLQCVQMPLNSEYPQAPQQEQDESQVHTWHFVAKRPTVEQWLAGMGETEFVKPDLAPEAPVSEAAEKANARRVALGRARVPASAVTAPVDIKIILQQRESLSNGEETSDAVEAHNEVGKQSEVSSADRQTKRATSGNTTNIHPMPAFKQENVPGTCHAVVDLRGQRSDSSDEDALEMPFDPYRFLQPQGQDDTHARGIERLAVSSVSTHVSIKPAINSDHQATQPCTEVLVATSPAAMQPEALSKNHRFYAQVDSYGLTGRAEAQAAWETTTVQESSIADDLRTASLHSGARQAGVSIHQKECMPSWAYKNAPYAPAIREVPLIDTKVGTPSGWPSLQEVGSKRTITINKRSQSGTGVENRSPRPFSLDNCRDSSSVSDDLIAFSDTTEYFSVRSASPAPNDILSERLADDESTPRIVLHRTMQQQARKRGVKNTHGTPSKGPQAVVPTQPLASQDAANSRWTTSETASAAISTTKEPSLEPLIKRLGGEVIGTGALIFASFLQARIDAVQSERFGVMLGFGIFLVPYDEQALDSVLPNHPLVYGELEKTLGQQHDSMPFAAQRLRPKECAGMYSEVLHSMAAECDLTVPPQAARLRIDLTTADGTHLTIEIGWTPVAGIIIGSLSILRSRLSVICPDHLWDCELTEYRSVDCLNADTSQCLTAFASSIEIRLQNDGVVHSGKRTLTAKIPQFDGKDILTIRAACLEKIFSKQLSRSTNTAIACGAAQGFDCCWVTTQVMPMTVHAVVNGRLVAVADSDEQLNMDEQSFWQAHLSISRSSDSASVIDFEWYESIARTLCDCANKMYFGKHRLGHQKRQAMHHKAECEDSCW